MKPPTSNQIQIFDLGNSIKPDPRSCPWRRRLGPGRPHSVAHLSGLRLNASSEYGSNKLRMVWTRNIHKHAKTCQNWVAWPVLFLSFLDLYSLGSVSCSNLCPPHLPGHYRSMGTWTCPNTEHSPLKDIESSSPIRVYRPTHWMNME